MKDITDLLLPFKAIITAMEGDKYPTLHGVLLWRRKLLLHCQTKFSDSGVVKCLKSNLRYLIAQKWPQLGLFKLALFCFPKFKSLSILPVSEREEVVHEVYATLSELISNEEASTSTALSINDHSYGVLQSKRKKVDYALDVSGFEDEPPKDENDEVMKYMAADFSADDYYSELHVGNFDILKFWDQQKFVFPKLSKLAHYLLSIPCSSAASERLFSCAGRGVQEERRTRLDPENIDSIVFLNSYWKSK